MIIKLRVVNRTQNNPKTPAFLFGTYDLFYLPFSTSTHPERRVLSKGFEPSRVSTHTVLSRTRLPVPPRERVGAEENGQPPEKSQWEISGSCGGSV